MQRISNSERLQIACCADDESSNVQNSDVELKERLELVEKELQEIQEELSKATAMSETLKKRHEDEMDCLRKDFDEDLEKVTEKAEQNLQLAAILEEQSNIIDEMKGRTTCS